MTVYYRRSSRNLHCGVNMERTKSRLWIEQMIHWFCLNTMRSFVPMFISQDSVWRKCSTLYIQQYRPTDLDFVNYLNPFTALLYRNGRDESVAHSALSTKATSNPAQRLFTESSSIGLFCHNASPEISDPYYERPRLVASFHEGAPRVNNTLS